MGADAAKTPDQNWDDALRIWPDIVAFAADHGRKLTFENCPMLFSYDEWPGGHNLATSPRIWRRILEQWGGTVGLNFDPSHLILQMIDIPRFIREFGPHILHVQAKDLMIDREGLYERGIFSQGIGWQIPRLPGLGDVEWAPLFAALWREGFDGDVIIEHEDRDFEKTDDLIKRGLPAGPRRPASLHQVSVMTLSIDGLTDRDIAKTIDHSLLRPELDDAFVEDGCRLAARYDVASVCVRPADVRPCPGHPGRHGRRGRNDDRVSAWQPPDGDEGRSKPSARWRTGRPSWTWSSRSAP